MINEIVSMHLHCDNAISNLNQLRRLLPDCRDYFDLIAWANSIETSVKEIQAELNRIKK